MTKRTYVGELGPIGQYVSARTLRAEATSWNILDVLVQMWTFQDGGYEVRETSKNGTTDIMCYVGPDEEEAYRMFLNRAFGA
jgi:hypothetical protein